MSETIFTVTGVDDEGDRHTFETADEDRANSVWCQFREDLTQVTMASLTVLKPAT